MLSVECLKALVIWIVFRKKRMTECEILIVLLTLFFVLLQISQYVFEETFNLLFAVPFTQHNATVSGATLAALSPAQISHIRRLNSLDLELYEFAKNLMFKRYVYSTHSLAKVSYQRL